jgi:UDPglucose--hexose-1-phosphate uridylyltransferase
MPEIRQNIATKEWVIIATERAKRPEDFTAEQRTPTHLRPPHVATCPFCPGNEAMTPPPSLVRIGADGSWQQRIVPNKFGALSPAAPAVRLEEGVARMTGGYGFHDVLIESPLHNTTTALLAPEEVAATLSALRDRARELARDERIAQIIPFKNHGESAGTSLEHPHCQMVSLPIVPSHIRQRLEEAMRYFDEHGTCVFCDMARLESEAAIRVVCEDEHFVAFIPYAAFSPFHTWILPRRHRSLFTQASDEELASLGNILKTTLLKLYRGLGDPHYNYMIRMAPLAYEKVHWSHWYLSIVPKVTRAAGFELGSGMYINTALPEESAAFLRAVTT